MQIRLDPPELGDLLVQISVRNGVIDASFQTSNADATQMLSHSLAQLKHSLESQGVSVDRLQVAQAPRNEKSDQQGSDRNNNQQSPQQGFDWAAPAPAPQLTVWPPVLDELPPDWREPVAAFLASPAGQALSARVQTALSSGAVVYPPEPFRALALTALGLPTVT